MPKPFAIAGLIAVLAGIGAFIALSERQRERELQDNDALIRRAIETGDKGLCREVTRTTRPGPTDGPMEVTGRAAVETCETEVDLGERIRGG